METDNTGPAIAEVLAEFLTTRSIERIPQRAIDAAKLFVVDVLGCMIGATDEPQARALFEVLQEEGGAPHSSVVAGGCKTSVMNAAFINGVKGHIFDFDDDHREGTMHPLMRRCGSFPRTGMLPRCGRHSGQHLNVFACA